MNIYQFMGENPFLTFFLAWLALHLMGVVYSRTMRAIMVCKNGWPPEHLDADGDFKPIKENEELRHEKS